MAMEKVGRKQGDRRTSHTFRERPGAGLLSRLGFVLLIVIVIILPLLSQGDAEVGTAL